MNHSLSAHQQTACAEACICSIADLQIIELLGVMLRQLQWLWTVAHRHMPTLVSSSHLSSTGLGSAQGSVLAAHASVQAFIQLCR